LKTEPVDPYGPSRSPDELPPAPPEEIFRLLVDAVQDYAIFALDVEGNIVTWNLGGQSLKGYLPEEVIGTNFRRFYTREDIDRGHPEAELKEAAEKGKYEEEGWRVKKDGSYFWANVVITALRNEDGVLRGFGKVTRDLTQKRKAELNLKESEERFRQLVESVPDYAIFRLDPQGNIATWNKGAERNKGYKAEEIIGLHFSKFYPEEDIKNGKPAMELREAVVNGRYEEEGWRLKKDGSRFWASVVITPIFDKGELKGFAKVTRNLTERKIAEDQLRNAYMDLERRIEERTRELTKSKLRAENAVKARDQFFSIASHELKTPLTSLKLQTQIRLYKIAKGDFSEFASDRIAKLFVDDKRQIERLSFLVDNMLDISNVTSGAFKLTYDKDVDLNELVKEVLKRMEPILGEVRCVGTLESVRSIYGSWDRHRIEQVITNLLSNAAKYAPGKPVKITVDGDSKMAKILVTDQGPGISGENQARIFQPFERIKSTSEVTGLGLGLFIIKQIVEAHNGTIRLESELTKGSTFIVELPIESECGPNTPAKA